MFLDIFFLIFLSSLSVCFSKQGGGTLIGDQPGLVYIYINSHFSIWPQESDDSGRQNESQHFSLFKTVELDDLI